MDRRAQLLEGRGSCARKTFRGQFTDKPATWELCRWDDEMLLLPLLLLVRIPI